MYLQEFGLHGINLIAFICYVHVEWEINFDK